MQPDFDQITPRRDTRSIKWDYVEGDGELFPLRQKYDPPYPQALPPLSLSDMDSPSPSSIQEALIIRLRHGIFGYTAFDDSYYVAIINWMARRHGWAIRRDWIITTNGVMQAINLVVQTMTQPGDNIIVQPPVFAPIGQAVSKSGRGSARHRFLLGED